MRLILKNGYRAWVMVALMIPCGLNVLGVNSIKLEKEFGSEMQGARRQLATVDGLGYKLKYSVNKYAEYENSNPMSVGNKATAEECI